MSPVRFAENTMHSQRKNVLCASIDRERVSATRIAYVALSSHFFFFRYSSMHHHSRSKAICHALRKTPFHACAV